MTAVAVLRAAAETLRATAEAAHKARPGTWQVGCAASVVAPCEGGYDYVTGYTTSEGTAVAEHIALMQPLVALALADWLEEAARGCDAAAVAAAHVWPENRDAQADFVAEQTPRHALALARLINPKEQ